MKERRKKFILGMTGCAFLAWVAKAIIAGAIQATTAFLLRRRWEKLQKMEASDEENNDIGDPDGGDTGGRNGQVT